MTQTPYQPQYNFSGPTKDRSIAFILELLPGLFGFLGIGWIYAGKTQTGVVILVCFFLWSLTVGIASVATAGIAAFICLPISLLAIAFSCIQLQSYTKQHPELFRP